MSGYRFDEMSECWVVIATGRRGVPMATREPQSAPAEAASNNANCPFCPGRESETEATLASFKNPDGTWRVRVVHNRYPIVTPAATVTTAAPGGRELAGIGVHELVVETPEHDTDWHRFSSGVASDVVRMYRDRTRALEAEPDIRAVNLYRNRGRRAGSSQPHPHAQLVATQVIPPFVERRQSAAARHAELTGTSLLDTVLARELASAVRIIEVTDEFVVLCPFAPHRAYETWIVPRTNAHSFGALRDDTLTAFGTAVQRSVARVHVATGDAAYNLLLRTPPVGTQPGPAAFWYLEIAPRTGGDAGLELGAGLDSVPIPPEETARALREANID